MSAAFNTEPIRGSAAFVTADIRVPKERTGRVLQTTSASYERYYGFSASDSLSGSEYKFTYDVNLGIRLQDGAETELELALIGVDFLNLRVTSDAIYTISTDLIYPYQLGRSTSQSVGRISLTAASSPHIGLEQQVTQQGGAITGALQSAVGAFNATKDAFENTKTAFEQAKQAFVESKQAYETASSEIAVGRALQQVIDQLKAAIKEIPKPAPLPPSESTTPTPKPTIPDPINAPVNLIKAHTDKRSQELMDEIVKLDDLGKKTARYQLKKLKALEDLMDENIAVSKRVPYVYSVKPVGNEENALSALVNRPVPANPTAKRAKRDAKPPTPVKPPAPTTTQSTPAETPTSQPDDLPPTVEGHFSFHRPKYYAVGKGAVRRSVTFSLAPLFGGPQTFTADDVVLWFHLREKTEKFVRRASEEAESKAAQEEASQESNEGKPKKKKAK